MRVLVIRMIFSLAVLGPVLTLAQIPVEKSALGLMDREKWSAARARLDKATAKDSLHAGAAYVLAIYFFHTANPQYNLDSASSALNHSRLLYLKVSPRERERLRKVQIDSMHFRALRYKIDSVAFDRAKALNTEASYSFFLESFPESKDSVLAKELRYEAAYMDALKTNTYEAFAHYLQRYPTSPRSKEAQAKYEWLLFETKTRDKRLASYESFLREHPSTAYRTRVEREIFLISTADGSQDSFLRFVNHYGHSSQAKVATDYLFHLLDEEDPAYDTLLLQQNDSLQQVAQRNKHYLIPYLEGDRFGFMDNTGRRIIEPRDGEPDRAYRCGAITEDVLAFEEELVTRDNRVIFKGPLEELDDLGHGFLTVLSEGCLNLLHKSGRRLDGCYEEVRLAGRFIALLMDSSWHLYTFTFQPVPITPAEDFKAFRNLLGWKTNGGWQLFTFRQIASLLDRQQLPENAVYDELAEWPVGQAWVRSGTSQGVLNDTLGYTIPMEEQTLIRIPYGSQSITPKGVRLYVDKRGVSELFQQVMIVTPWVAVETTNAWQLYDVDMNQLASPPYDTLFFAGSFPIGARADSLFVHFAKGHVYSTSVRHFGVVPGRDTLTYLWLADPLDSDRKSVFDASGRLLFTTGFDKISYAGKGVFIITRKDKKGLIRRDGVQILPADFDALGDATGNWIPTLRKMKFGFYDLATSKEIKPSYDKNLQRYNDRLAVAFRAGKYGFITADNKVQGTFEYDEIKYWNDTAALARKDFRWVLLNVITQKPLIEGIKDFRFVSDTDAEKVAIIHRENFYGVISNRRGEVLPSTFTDIVNVGTREDPVYFAEKNVEEASLFVVIYYNSKGTLIHRQAFEEDQYDRIYCPDN